MRESLRYAIYETVNILLYYIALVQDIRNQRRYRNNRKQELMRLRTTIKSLSDKRTFYESQIDYYNQYVKTCMDSLQHKSK